MKKIEYQAPEMEVIKLNNQSALLSASMDEGSADITNPDAPERE